MTQEEYLNLSPEEQNALFATEVLGWERGTFLKSVPTYFENDEYIFNAHAFDPRNNLDHAFMGVDKIQKDNKGWRFSLLGGDVKPAMYRTKEDEVVYLYHEEIPFGWGAEFFGEYDPHENYGQRHASVRDDTPNQAIMLACLRAKGVVE